MGDTLGLYFDRQGKPITHDQWSALIQLHSAKIVAQSAVGGFYVSTVWMGIDMGMGLGPPLIFETMVWEEATTGPPPWQGEDLLQWRYSTEDQARKGHQNILAMIKAGRFRDFLATGLPDPDWLAQHTDQHKDQDD